MRDPGSPSADLSGLLTERQLEIVCCLADGLTYHQIAQRLRISPHTVHEHVRHIYERLGTHNRTHLLVSVVLAGICDLMSP